ncbi:uroporphyrinogen-III synthase [Pikeienuella piscinae]|uniref:Uroporphyrinogen-III synthase n=1 Tax=Pikeienuella piscinae TaxID=2748098 RepID=A0A7L5BTT0_9RHOB|nr:uroporphyrinogen-III synthase [Pikeienuella piscinae]QIE55075.1 uroporphyrinogen-III synthase [Pikeienuella piscinae]
MPLVLLTRPRRQSDAFAAEIAADGWDALIWPVMEIVHLLPAPPDLSDADALIFTSARALEALLQHGPPPALPAYCVGPATADAARRAGFDEVIEGGGDAVRLLAVLKAAGLSRPAHVRGRDIAMDISAALRDTGADARDIVAYEARPAGPPGARVDAAMRAGRIDAVAFFSPRTAALFAKAAPYAWRPRLATIEAAAISAAAAAALAPVGFANISVAERPDGAAMRALLRRSAA